MASITASSLLGYDATSFTHLYLGRFSHSSVQILSSSVSDFHVSPEMFDLVQFKALAGPLKDIQRLVPKPLLRCLGCMLWVFVLLEGEPSPQSEVLSNLEQILIKDLSVLSLDPD